MNLALIKSNPNNPRVIKDAKFDQLVESIRSFPKMLELRPIIIDEGNVVVGGNMRLKALQALKFTNVPDTWVRRATDFTPEEIKEFIIKDNLPFGEWDWAALATEDWNAEDLTAWGLEIPNYANPELEQDDFVEPDEIQTDIRRGDLFEIGNHYLLCGDATNLNDVVKLLKGKEPYLMVTDPPYGVNYKPVWRHQAHVNNSNRTKAVQNDDVADWSGAWALSPSRVAYVWHSAKFTALTQESLEKSDFIIRCQIIWNKQQMVSSRGDYHWKHEPCWYAVKKGSKGNWAGDRKQTTVWDIESILQSSKHGSENDAQSHGTQKPVECMGRPIQNHDGDVYDPFCGSGTTIIAAEQLGRRCYAMELDPKCCQMIIDRVRKYKPEIEIRNGS